MKETFYDILEISENASSDDIKKAYRKLSLKFHPDKNNNSSESQAKFQLIGEAYETLSDKDKKRQYDMMRNNPFASMMGQGFSPGQGQGFAFPFPNQGQGQDPIEELFSNLFGFGLGPGPGPGPGPRSNQEQNQFSEFNINESFGPNIRIFRQGSNGHSNGPFNIQQQLQKPTPIIKTVNISISQVLTSSTVPVEIERWIVENGTKVFEKETIYVNIPQGVDDNEIIIIREKGNVVNDVLRGDIKLFIKVENNTDLKRNGLDLILEKKIKLKEALCGFSFELKYLNGKLYTINNSIGNIIPPNHRKVINNMGICREGCTGNLIIVFDIEFPEKLNTETINALKDLL
jgi:DnaJ-class molecular chaperone